MKDQLNRTVSILQTPKRIVSLVPSQTELLVDLGLVDTIVGVTKFCVHPKQLRKEKTVVGRTKQVRFDKIKALKPDIILCNKEENTKKMITELEHIAPVHISDIYTIEDSLELTKMYGVLFNVTEEAQSIIDKIKIKCNDIKEFKSVYPEIKIIIVDGEAFSWYGSRLLKAFDYFEELQKSI